MQQQQQQQQLLLLLLLLQALLLLQHLLLAAKTFSEMYQGGFLLISLKMLMHALLCLLGRWCLQTKQGGGPPMGAPKAITRGPPRGAPMAATIRGPPPMEASTTGGLRGAPTRGPPQGVQGLRGAPQSTSLQGAPHRG